MDTLLLFKSTNLRVILKCVSHEKLAWGQPANSAHTVDVHESPEGTINRRFVTHTQNYVLLRNTATNGVLLSKRRYGNARAI